MAGRQRISLEIRRKMIADHAQGDSFGKISRNYGRDISTVSRFLRRYYETGQIEPGHCRNGRPSLSQEEIEKIRLLLKANPNLTLREIKEQLGLKFTTLTISRSIKEHIPGVREVKRSKKLTPEIREKIIEDLSKGFKSSEIASKYGCCAATVNRILKRYREENRVEANCKRVTQEVRDGVVRARVCGVLIRKIAEKYGISVTTVYLILKKHPNAGLITPRKRKRKKIRPEDIEQVAVDFNKGLPRSKIAADIGRSIGAVDNMLRKLRVAGLVQRKRKGVLPEDIELMVADHRKGMTVREIAANSGYAFSTVEKKLIQLRRVGKIKPRRRLE